MNNVVVTFGEIMTRLSAPGHRRIRQCLPGQLDAGFAGAESNIASAIALLGRRSRFVTALPKNWLGDAAVDFLRSHGVDTSHILRTDHGRMAQYFIETGAGLRPGRVLYDRDFSSFSLTEGLTYDWNAILADASWLVLTGISPALSATAAEATLQAAREAKSRGIPVCCDLNFRATLWKWQPGKSPRDLAREVMSRLVPHVDLLLTNPDQAADVLGIPWDGVPAGTNPADAYAASAGAIARAHPHIKRIVFTMRESHSASRNALGALLYEITSDTIHLAPVVNGEYTPYEMDHIVDRLGAGDAFAGGLLHALQTPGLAAPQRALDFALAAAALAHSIPGDINVVTQSEVEALLTGDRTGRVVR